MKFKSYVTREVMIEYLNHEFRCQRKSHYPFMHKKCIPKKINETTVYHCSNISYYSAVRAFTAYIGVYILYSYLMCSWAIHLTMSRIQTHNVSGDRHVVIHTWYIIIIIKT
jgi:hypothetical protein